jgi:hypothetical protein
MSRFHSHIKVTCVVDIKFLNNEVRIAETSMNSSRVINRVRMGAEMVVETSVSYRHMTWLISREDLIEFSRHESSRSYFAATVLLFKWRFCSLHKIHKMNV